LLLYRVHTIFLLLSLLAGLAPASAQNTSIRGRFEVDFVKGCAPLTVNVTEIENLGLAKTYRYEGRFSQEREEKTYTYTTPGIYYIWELTASTDFDSIRVEVVPNVAPHFEIYTCANRGVKIEILNTLYDTYEVDFTNDGTPESTVNSGEPVPAYNYGALGNFTITVKGQDTNAASNCQPNPRTFTTLDNLPVGNLTRSEVLSTTDLALEYTLPPNIYHQLELALNNNPAFALVDKLEENSTGLTLDNLNNEANFYRFRIGTRDLCANTIAHSAVLSSIRMQLSVQNNLNQLTWATQTTGMNSFTVARNTDPTFASPALAATSFDDTDLICGNIYCYTLTATYPSGAQSISIVRCGEAISNDTPSPINSFTASTVGQTIELAWEPPTAFVAETFSVFRAEPPGSSFRFVGNTQTPAFTSVSSEESQVCFRIDYLDQCGNLSEPGKEGCTVFLSGTGAGVFVQLSWTDYTGWETPPTAYVVEKYIDGQLAGTFPVGTHIELLDTDDDPNNQVVVYRIRAISSDPLLPDAYSNTLTFVREPVIRFPSAFTPDSNGLNDEFRVIGRYIRTYRLDIFNRWGELLFTTQNPATGWDGIYRGRPLPQGSYIYKVEIVDFTGKRHVHDGQVMLLRTR
jgi:gliding motility-associated-like protein